MATFIERKDYNLLLIALKFCRQIDIYSDLLGLDDELVEGIKRQNELFAFIFKNNSPRNSDEKFNTSQVDNLRISLSYLAQRCRKSPNYSMQIGQDLGIEVSTYAFQYN